MTQQKIREIKARRWISSSGMTSFFIALCFRKIFSQLLCPCFQWNKANAQTFRLSVLYTILSSLFSIYQWLVFFKIQVNIMNGNRGEYNNCDLYCQFVPLMYWIKFDQRWGFWFSHFSIPVIVDLDRRDMSIYLILLYP